MIPNKRFLLLLSLAIVISLIFYGCSSDNDVENYYGETYGETFNPEDYENVKIDRIINNHGEYSNKVVVVTGEIGQVCPTAGCWLIINDGPNSLYIELFDFTVALPVRTQVAVLGEVRTKNGQPYLAGRGIIKL